ncbi:hypothetical protein B0J13DRAFT_656892 [Dactylonectria estremocensis]|uniref:Uncharacterized protein n=1 Tax=Dactylonectria estremocensis TaxID=1079267 RepID=A0A9P9D4X0_9HYPO|nr:hypothetical protein B0J13DRAFT_656892 [Dactylonectria estremocensis]
MPPWVFSPLRTSLMTIPGAASAPLRAAGQLSPDRSGIRPPVRGLQTPRHTLPLPERPGIPLADADATDEAVRLGSITSVGQLPPEAILLTTGPSPRLRPSLAVFGHIHVSYGREDVVLDGVQRLREEVLTGWTGWDGVFGMALLVLWVKVKRLFRILKAEEERATVFVNAAMVGGPENELRNDPVVVKL